MGYSEEATVRELLAPLERIETTAFELPVGPPARRSRRSPVLVAAVISCALAGAGVAIAAGAGAFDRISAAEHPQGAADVVDPATAAILRQSHMGIAVDSTRLVGQLPSGRRFYVASNAGGDLCVVVEQLMAACGPNLNHDHPITIAYMNSGKPGEPPVSYGVAMDGVTAVSFTAGGQQVTVPVKNNVWAYEGVSSVIASATVHFADGTTLQVNHEAGSMSAP